MNLSSAITLSRQTLLSIYGEGETDAVTDLLLEAVCGFRRSDWQAKAGFELSGEQEKKFHEYLSRLQKQEPIQYVIGEAWFCGLKFKVDQRVLIPRPETEELVEWIISHCRFPLLSLQVLDIGTGSGCIPIALKRRLRKATVTSLDISSDALALATENARSIGTEVQFLQADFLQKENRTSLEKYDVIVSNPPYVPEQDKTAMHPNVLEHEPHLALFVPDNDPLLFYKAIAEFGLTHLNEGGQIFLEIHESFGAEVSAFFRKAGYATELKTDMQGKNRMVRCWKK